MADQPDRLFSLIRSDVEAKAGWMYDGVSTGTILKTLLTDGTFAMLTYRLMQASHRCGLGPLAMFFNKLNVIVGQCIIGRGADFGPRFVLIHSQGIVINSAVRGGCGVFLEHQVTIGAEKDQAPQLHDEIFVGAGAKIIGAICVGSHTKVGANAVVTKDVPDGATVVGVPARVVKLYSQPVETENS
jgi:serine O-acetyltransferase